MESLHAAIERTRQCVIVRCSLMNTMFLKCCWENLTCVAPSCYTGLELDTAIRSTFKEVYFKKNEQNFYASVRNEAVSYLQKIFSVLTFSRRDVTGGNLHSLIPHRENISRWLNVNVKHIFVPSERQRSHLISSIESVTHFY